MSLAHLPPSVSKYWEGDKQTIDMAEVKNLLCEEHIFNLFIGKREAKCANCPLTLRITPTTIEIADDGKSFTIRGETFDVEKIYP